MNNKHQYFNLINRSLILAIGILLSHPLEDALGQNYRTDSHSTYTHVISLYDSDGLLIDYKDKFSAEPYSPTMTCGKCHDTEKIHHGWHFNALYGNHSGREGEPWIWTDPKTFTQIPITYRDWIGSFKPSNFGLSQWQMMQQFGRHMPGQIAQKSDLNSPEPGINRTHITGNLEVDCMMCHSHSNRYNPDEWAKQVANENFKWAPTAALGLATILGETKDAPIDYDPEFDEFGDSGVSMPTTKYDQNKFEANGRVFFDVVRMPKNESCYQCHTNHSVDEKSPERYHRDLDVHIQAGMNCSDCHRHGLDHQVSRNYVGESQNHPNLKNDTLTCQQCHIGDQSGSPSELAGRLGAPIAKHKGIPPIHFDRLTCTACHSGPWPEQSQFKVQTSMAHSLGLAKEDRSPDDLPHIIEPVFVENKDGQIEPRRMFWPSYWAVIEADSIKPLPIDKMDSLAKWLKPIVADEEGSSSHKTFHKMTEAQLKTGLAKLQNTLSDSQKAAYVDGVTIHQLNNDVLESKKDSSLNTYSWALAHDVRPAGQSLGVRGCVDCHSVDAPFFFSDVKNQSLYENSEIISTPMTQLQNIDHTQTINFAKSFTFRSLFKALLIGCTILLSLLVIIYFSKWLFKLTQALHNE